MILLDTSSVIELLKGTSKGLELKTLLENEVCAVSAVTVYEVLYGVRTNELESTNSFFENVENISLDAEICRKAVEIEKVLQRNGKTISKFDLFIASTCIVHSIPLASLDADFKVVPGLKVVNY